MTNFLFLLVLLACCVCWQVAEGVARLEIATPLQSLTIPDPETVSSHGALSYRSRFLPQFRSGLQAEAAVVEQQQQQQASAAADDGSGGVIDPSSPEWATQAAQRDESKAHLHEQLLEQAYDKAILAASSSSKKPKRRPKNPNRYQFVGVIRSVHGHNTNADEPIQWYARPKPRKSSWSLRLVHVNREAVLYDLIKRGKLDVFGKYNGKHVAKEEVQYSVRERSWKNLWNFSPRHFFSDSSGMYWRERRLPEGWYTDGDTVYEASYRYRDGRNGMRRLGKLLPGSKWERRMAQRKAQGDAPDVVLEG